MRNPVIGKMIFDLVIASVQAIGDEVFRNMCEIKALDQDHGRYHDYD